MYFINWLNRGVSSSQKPLKKYGPLRTHSGDIVSFRGNKIGHRSSENGPIQDIDFGDGLSTLAPVAAKNPSQNTDRWELILKILSAFGKIKSVIAARRTVVYKISIFSIWKFWDNTGNGLGGVEKKSEKKFLRDLVNMILELGSVQIWRWLAQNLRCGTTFREIST